MIKATQNLKPKSKNFNSKLKSFAIFLVVLPIILGVLTASSAYAQTVTPTITATPTATRTPTPALTVTPTSATTSGETKGGVPVTGVSGPTVILGIGAALFILLGILSFLV